MERHRSKEFPSFLERKNSSHRKQKEKELGSLCSTIRVNKSKK